MALSFLLRSLKNRVLSQPKTTERRSYRPSLELLEDRMAPAIFTVTNINDAGAGSLRAAILSANAAVGADTINFNISVGTVATINVLSALPTVTGPVTIAGDTQPIQFHGMSGPRIVLNGAGAGVASGLTLKAAGSVVRFLTINNFQSNGLLIYGSNSVVEGCFIGTNSAGAAAAANQGYGVLIAGAATNVRIGGATTATQRNIISGNGLSGVAIIGALTTANKVQGNYIGTNAGGNADLGNAFDGVFISGGSKNNVIGGTVAGAGNVISGNNSDGVEISGVGATGNVLQGNFIGTNAASAVGLGNSDNGVRITNGAANNTVGGTVAAARNVISGNVDSGVDISGVGTTGNKVQGNFIGTTAAGNDALGNGSYGVFIQSSANNTVGGTIAGARNVISGNTGAGVQLVLATGNLVQGNYIGTDAAGTGALGNATDGVFMQSSANNTVGGTIAGARNVISGNSGAGVWLVSATGNLVQGNYIGTTAAGNDALGNEGDGVGIHSSSANNTVGGTVAGAGNVISGNGRNGIDFGTGAIGNKVQGNFIGTTAAGNDALGNGRSGVVLRFSSWNTTVGGTVAGARNVISSNAEDGVFLDGSATGNVLQGNYIGTNAAGTGALGNRRSGVVMYSHNNTLGGTVAGAGNVISSHSEYGVICHSGNLVQGNFIGTNAAGTAALGNAVGVYISGYNNTVGGTVAGARNVISGNTSAVYLVGTGNVLQGNFIGTNAAGTAALGNFQGVEIRDGAANNTVGGTVAGARNVISGNANFCVYISGFGTTGNVLQGNFIGTNAAGTAALANNFGVVIDGGAANNTVGGTVGGARNVISGNNNNGVDISGAGTSGNLVQGNFIGTNAAGTGALGNALNGVLIWGSAANNLIGGTVAGAGNRIANNGDDGVWVHPNAGIGNSILGNSIFNNGDLGIDLDAFGATPNDLNDPDPGPNNILNTPVLSSAFLSGASLELSGFLNTVVNSTLRIEFFANTATSQTFLGFQTLVMGANNTIVFFTTLTVPATVLAGQTLTATVTDELGNTSEFSIALTIE